MKPRRASRPAARSKPESFGHVRDVIEAAISGEFHRLLKAEGYRRSAHSWRQRDDKRVRIVNVQSSDWNAAGRGMFTINLGIYDFRLQRLVEKADFWPPPRRREPVEHNCAIRTRIGRLLPLGAGRVDYWWKVTRRTNPSRLEAELVEVLRKHALPWLAKASDYRYALRHSMYGRGTHAAKAIEKLSARKRKVSK